MSNIETVQKIYAAFGQRDVPAILDLVAENVDWNHQDLAARELPWYGNFSGKQKLPGFFAAIAEHLDIPVFEPKEFMSDSTHVAVRLRLKLVMKKNGKAGEFDAIHFWSFDAAGKVSRYRHFNDSAAELEAWRA